MESKTAADDEDDCADKSNIRHDLVAPGTDTSIEGVREFFETLFENNPYYSFIGLRVGSLAPGEADLYVEEDGPELTTPNPPALESLHGGVIATLADISSAVAIVTEFDGEIQGFATVSVNIDYKEAAHGRVDASAEVTDISEKTVEAEVTLTSDGEEVAVGKTVWRVFRDPAVWNHVSN